MQMTLAAFLALVPTIITFLLFLVAIKNKKESGHREFSFLILSVFLWSFFYFLELISIDFEMKVIFLKLSYLGIATSPVFLFLFSFTFLGKIKTLSARSFFLLLTIPLTVIFFVFTNEFHYLYYSSVLPDNSPFSKDLILMRGPLYFLHIAYSYLMILLCFLTIFKALKVSKGVFRIQAILFLLGALVAVGINAVYVFPSFELGSYDFTNFGLGLSCIFLFWGISRFQMLKINPIAKDIVMDRLTSGIIVLDSNYLVVDANPFFLSLIGKINEKVIGEKITEVSAETGIFFHESLKSGSFKKIVVLSERQFTFELIPIYTRKRNEGFVIFLSDISDLLKTQRLLNEKVDELSELNRISTILGMKETVKETAFSLIKNTILRILSSNQKISEKKDFINSASGILKSFLERKRVEEEIISARNTAQKANQEKSAFLATMSHEIRNPLHGIIGLTEVLLSTSLEQKQYSYAENLRNSANMLSDILNSILDFSKIESGKIELELISFDLLENLDILVKNYENIAFRKDLKLNFSVNGKVDRYFIGDPVKINQILLNLLSNALKFTEKGNINLTVSQKDINSENGMKSITFEVSDTGIGISQDNISRVFEKFLQGDNSVSRKFGGTGLGLSISKSLSQLMGGDIEVKSHEGMGSQFIVSIKLKADPEKGKNISAKEKVLVDKKILSDKKVLIAEDNEINIIIISKNIQDLGGEVYVAKNGVEAFETFQKEKPDLVIMDIFMPEMDGIDASKKIREIENREGLSRVPIIALSADLFSDFNEKGKAAGIDFCLSKPFKKADLAETLRKAFPE